MTLKNRIKDLEEQLKEAQQHTYVDENAYNTLLRWRTSYRLWRL